LVEHGLCHVKSNKLIVERNGYD